ncbi:MAG: DUF2784 domain-containing protein [Casimicrobiaceae bacterium]
MIHRLLADALVALHFVFIVFVLFGGLLALWRWKWTIVHVPAALWGAYSEFTSTICPLTPWENVLRQRAGEGGYSGGFIEHYLLPLIYPVGLTPHVQFGFGVIVVVFNVIVYAAVWRRWRALKSSPASDAPARSSGLPDR